MLEGKAVLAVDDEPDVLETIVEVLYLCRVDTAGSFNQAEKLLQTRDYDVVILDVMGVRGLHLLDIAVQRKFPAVMLTAPALSPDYILRAMDRGAISYIPKEDLANLDSLLVELLDIISQGNSPWRHTLTRLEPLLDERFPSDWRQQYRALWDSLDEKSPKLV
ncbi:MAG: response regulator [Desulfomonile tiedjei]|nr:response regulator [Desulfomonile tiedjei]